MISASASSAAITCCRRRASRLVAGAAVRGASSDGGRIAEGGECRRSPATKNAFRRGGTRAHKSTFPSSGGAAAAASALAESAKDYVKSQVLEEVTRTDSAVWEAGKVEPTSAITRGHDNNDVKRTHKIGGLNGDGSASVDEKAKCAIGPSGASKTRKNGEHNINLSKSRGKLMPNGATSMDHGPIPHPCIDDAIRGHDPEFQSPDRLDEWHLNDRPGRYFDVQNGHAPIPPDGVLPAALADPFELSRSEIELLSEGIRRDLIGTDHPVLNRAASYFFDEREGGAGGGKKVRPVMVMLLSGALERRRRRPELPPQRPDLVDAQRRLGQIAEMIHTASLFHDDVIDGADTRRGVPAVHGVFGNKVAILAGDFLLARASIYLARLRDVEVVETMSTIIEHLVRGEVMQMKPPSPSSPDVQAQLEYYLHKTYYKTASLMANSCKSAAILGGHDPAVVDACYRYGKHVGMAFQLVDDVLDFTGDSSATGKPALADLTAGVVTAPVLFAAGELEPDDGGRALRDMMGRGFRGEGDVEGAVDLVVGRSGGVRRTEALARVHAELAIDAALELGVPTTAGDDEGFGPGRDGNEHRDALIHLAYKVVDRTR